MVKYLLDQGINIHERCYGNFFCPDDQKASRNDSLEHELVDVSQRTNYQGSAGRKRQRHEEGGDHPSWVFSDTWPGASTRCASPPSSTRKNATGSSSTGAPTTICRTQTELGHPHHGRLQQHGGTNKIASCRLSLRCCFYVNSACSTWRLSAAPPSTSRTT